MCAKNIITVGMIRRANEKMMQGYGRSHAGTTPYSSFLGKEVPNPVGSNSEIINSAWKKVREQSRRS